MEIKNAKKINEKSAYVGGVINISDLKKYKENIYVRTKNEESIIIQYWLFFHGWRTTKRKFKKIIKGKEFEAICNKVISIRPNGTFHSIEIMPSLMNGIIIDYNDLIKIFDEGYCYIQGEEK